MFAIERRNHSKTGVYGDLCARVPVDTPLAVDKLKKGKKIFKSERFDCFFRFCPIRLRDSPDPLGRSGMRGRNSGRACGEGHLCVVGRSEASRSQIGREASKMDRHPFESQRSTRGQRSGLKIYPVLPRITRLREPTAVMRSSCPQNSEHPEIAAIFRRRCLRSNGRQAILDSLDGFDRRSPRDLQAAPCTITLSGSGLAARQTLPFLLLPKAAQPLQYYLGEGWNDCTSTQKAAGRDKEETTQ